MSSINPRVQPQGNLDDLDPRVISALESYTPSVRDSARRLLAWWALGKRGWLTRQDFEQWLADTHTVARHGGQFPENRRHWCHYK